jgi:hypothetical protein
MKTIVITIMRFISSCSYLQPKHKKVASPKRSNLIVEKAKTYVSLNEEMKPNQGIMKGDCDWLLHNAIAYLSGIGTYETILSAQDDDGRLWRTPERDCLSSGRSKSTVSGDMVLGFILATTVKGHHAALEKFIEHAEQSEWFIGDHDGSLDGQRRVSISSQLQALAYRARHFLTGEKHWKMDVPTVYSPVKGFQAHLQTLTILTNAIVNKGMTQVEVNTLKSQLENDPKNALFAAILARFTDGDFAVAQKVLLDESLFPSDRLPSAKDRCVSYLWMHGEKPSDWTGCKGHEHHGHDLTFASWVMHEL